MKKVVTIVLLISILFNFICCNSSYVYAAESDDIAPSASTYVKPMNSFKESNIFADLSEGTTSQKNGDTEKVSTSSKSYGNSIIGFIVGLLARFVNVFVVQLDLLMSLFTTTTILDSGSAPDIPSGTSSEFSWFTIDKAVFNRIALFNINYFDIPEDEEDATYTVGDTVISQNSSNIAIKKQVSKVYYSCRLIALSISLVVLIYIGIRMALSTVASDVAKYKKMLMGWVESILILFIMLYIMAAILAVGDTLTGVFYDLRNDLFDKNITTSNTSGKYGVFEDTIRQNALNLVTGASGLKLGLWSIVYWFLLYMEFKFLWAYLKRFLMVGFLIIISPFITVTYSIDKVGDNKAQAFSKWVKEFLTNVLIQPLHALLYLIFVFSANSIALEAPLVGIAFLFAMTQAERVIKKLFDIEGLTTLRGLDHFRKGKK